jgi:uncharacterized protein YhfF
MTEQEQVQVTQADRDAAAFAWARWHSTDTLAEAFARHRHTATAEALEAMREAREALREYACHGGAEAPCRRSKEQCRTDCGKVAGDAFTRLTAAIAKIEGEQP